MSALLRLQHLVTNVFALPGQSNRALRPAKRFFTTCMLMAWGAFALCAVGTTGALVGVVTDPSGGVVPGAKVTAINVETGAERSVDTNPDGGYLIPLLPPGTYQLVIEEEGFRGAVFEDLKLNVDQTLRIDVQLELGTGRFAVTVTGTPLLLETDTSSRGGVLQRRSVADLPLNQRNFLTFTLLVPGASTSAYGSLNTAQGGAIHVNGAREQANNFLLDGVDNNDPWINQYSVLPPVEAIEEFKVQSANAESEFGQVAGAQINVVLRSGTNELHGSVFGLMRNRHLDAKNFFDLPDCTPESVPGTCAEIPRFDRNQFGGSLGGPIQRDKLFFFSAYEGLRLRQASTRQAAVPSQKQREATLAAVPPSERNPSGEAAFNLYPAANVGTDLAASNIFVAAPVIRNEIDQLVAKTDFHASSKDTLSGHYALFDQVLFNPFDPTAGLTNLPGFGSDVPRRAHSARFGWTRTLTASLVNEFRFGFNQVRTALIPENAGTNFNEALGFPSFTSDPVFWGFPGVTIPGFDPMSEARALPGEPKTQTIQIADNIAWTPGSLGGRHHLKFGGNFRRSLHSQLAPPLVRGDWSFFGAFTGDPLADLLRGNPAFALAGQGDVLIKLRRTALNLYVHDDLRVTQRFVLNLGLRYEYNSPPTSRRGPLFVPDLSPASASCTPQPDCQFIPDDSPGIPRGTFEKDLNNFAPRIGFAWRPLSTDRFVVRSAYGVFYNSSPMFSSDLLRLNPPGFRITFFSNRGQDTIQSIVEQDGTESAALSVRMDPRLRDGYLQQWNFNIQYEAFHGLIVDLAYVGSKGTKLESGRDVNQPAEGGGVRPFPQFGPVVSIESRGSSSYNAFQLRAEKQFTQGFGFLAAYTWAKSIDNASSQLGFADGESMFPQNSDNLGSERSLSTFHTAHRFVLSAVQELPLGSGKRWLNQPGLLRDIFGGWQTGFIVTLQTGQPFSILRSVDQSGTGPGPAGDRSDRPDLISDPMEAGPVPNHPDPACHLTASRGGRAADVVKDPASWYNPCAFAAPPEPRFGTAPRNAVIGPGLANLDLSLAKVAQFGRDRRKRLELRAEFFNLLNTPHFDLPENFFDSARFAAVGSSNASGGRPSRQIQLGLRFVF